MLILSMSSRCGLLQCNICEMHTALKGIRTLQKSTLPAPHLECDLPLIVFPRTNSQHPSRPPLVTCQEADLCSPWHPDCPLAAPGGVPWLRSCGASCPRSAVGPSAGCWTTLRTGSSTSPPLFRHFRQRPPWARGGKGGQGGTLRCLWELEWKGMSLEKEEKR